MSSIHSLLQLISGDECRVHNVALHHGSYGCQLLYSRTSGDGVTTQCRIRLPNLSDALWSALVSPSSSHRRLFYPLPVVISPKTHITLHATPSPIVLVCTLHHTIIGGGFRLEVRPCDLGVYTRMAGSNPNKGGSRRDVVSSVGSDDLLQDTQAQYPTTTTGINTVLLDDIMGLLRRAERSLFDTATVVAAQQARLVVGLSGLPQLTAEVVCGWIQQRIQNPSSAHDGDIAAISATTRLIDSILLPHQREAVGVVLSRHTLHRGRILLADGMGTGKSLEALAIVSTLQQQYISTRKDSSAPATSPLTSSPFPLLIIAPASVRGMWAGLAEQLLYPYFAERVSSTRSRSMFVCSISSETHILPTDASLTPMVVVTSVSLAHTLSNSLGYCSTKSGAGKCRRPWGCVIVDESHSLKPLPQSSGVALESGMVPVDCCQSTQTVVDLCSVATYCLLLSGTPTTRSPIDMSIQMAALQPTLMQRSFPPLPHQGVPPSTAPTVVVEPAAPMVVGVPPNLPTRLGYDYCEVRSGSRGHQEFGACTRLDEFKWVLDTAFWLRRTPEEVFSGASSHTNNTTQFSAPELKRSLVFVDAEPNPTQSPSMDAGGEEWGCSAAQSMGMSKVPAVSSLVHTLITQEMEAAHPHHPIPPVVVVFAHHRSVLAALHKAIITTDVHTPVSVLTISGETSMAARRGVLERIRIAVTTSPSTHPNNNDAPSHPIVLLLSITACGVGIDLSFCKMAVMAEVPPDRGWLAQAEARLCRPDRVGSSSPDPLRCCNIYVVLQLEKESHRWAQLNTQSNSSGPILSSPKGAGTKRDRVEKGLTPAASSSSWGRLSLEVEWRRGTHTSSSRREGNPSYEYGWGLSINAPAATPTLHLLQLKGKGSVVVVAAVASVKEVREFILSAGANTPHHPMLHTLQSAIDTLLNKSPFWVREVQRKGTVFWGSASSTPPLNESHQSSSTGPILHIAPLEYERSPQAYTPTTVHIPANNNSIVFGMDTNDEDRLLLQTFLTSRLPPLPTTTPIRGVWVYVGVSLPTTAIQPPPTYVVPTTKISFYTGWLVGGVSLMCLCCRNRAVWTYTGSGSKIGDHILIPNPTLSLNDLFCSGWCRSEFAVRGGVSGRLRQAVGSLDGGVCSQCGLDGTALLIELQAISAHSNPAMRSNHLRDAILRHAPHFGDHPTILTKLTTSHSPPTAGQLWHADHVVPVHLGGGGCDLDNIQTLCVACHADKTSIECAAYSTKMLHK